MNSGAKPSAQIQRGHPGGRSAPGSGAGPGDQPVVRVLEDEQGERHRRRASRGRAGRAGCRPPRHDQRADEGEAQRQRRVRQHLDVAQHAAVRAPLQQEGGEEQGRADRRDDPRGPCPARRAMRLMLSRRHRPGQPRRAARVPGRRPPGRGRPARRWCTSVHTRPSRNGHRHVAGGVDDAGGSGRDRSGRRRRRR